MNSVKIKHSLLLVITALIWGIAFVAQSEGGDAVGPYTFNCIRSIIGGIVLLPVIYIMDKKEKSEDDCNYHKKDNKPLLIGGISCGIILCLATNIQQLGLYYGTSAGKAGFLTACYILLVPILGLFLKKKCGWNIWVGVMIAIMGLYLLCINGSISLQFSDLLLMLCAIIFAVHILVIDHFSPLVSGVKLSCIQFFVCGILTSVPMFISDMNHSLSGIDTWLSAFTSWDAWIAILYAGVFSSGVAYTFQIIGQKGLNPTVASLIMSLESVFSVLAGWVLLGESMSTKELTGCVLIFSAIILAQLPVKSGKISG